MKKLEITDTSRDLFPGPKTADVLEIEAMFNAYRNVAIWQHKVEKFQRKVDKLQRKIY